MTVQWSGANDPGSCPTGIGGYSWAWTRSASTVPDKQQESNQHTTQTTSPSLADSQSWYFHVRARDKAAHWANGAKHYGPFWIDTHEPTNPTWVQESHGAPQGWQNEINDPAFSWGGASDAQGSGVDHYTRYWGTESDGAPNVNTTSTSFDPPAPCVINEACTRYLRIQTTDVAGLSSDPKTLYTFRYDGATPSGSFEINNGSEVTYQVMVQIHIDASDIGSDLHRMRFSNDGLNWDGWQPYAPDVWWQLDAIPNMTRTVYLELRDLAGNITALPSQSIYLDLSGAKPASENYQILTDVQGRGGGTRLSASYHLTNTVGQVIAGDGAAGQLYEVQSGFQGAWPAQPSGPPPVEHYQLMDSVVGEGGGYMASPSYQLNGTTGQNTETGERSSSNYTLVSGYWARVQSGGEPPPTDTPTPEITDTPTPTPTFTPTPTSTPPPEYYGVSINEAALYTHDYQVVLSLEAPDAVEMMVSNDGGFADAYWEAFAITKTWEIDFYQDYVLPRIVYVRFKDADDTIHGNFTDDIIYDPNLPTGDFSITEVGDGTVSLHIDLQDDLSGVSEMLVSSTDNLATAEWEPYSAWKTIPAQPGDTVYVYYRDAAGNESLYPLTEQVPGGMHERYVPIVFKGY